MILEKLYDINLQNRLGLMDDVRRLRVELDDQKSQIRELLEYAVEHTPPGDARLDLEERLLKLRKA